MTWPFPLGSDYAHDLGRSEGQEAVYQCGADLEFSRLAALQTKVHLITTGVILALLAVIAQKLKSFGPDD